MMAVERIGADDEVYDFLISAPTPEQIIAFRPSQPIQERMSYLLDANRAGVMTPEERAELDEFMKIEHFMRGIKLRAMQKIAQP
jgi:hypothetical protein